MRCIYSTANAATLAAAIGTGIYEACQASILRTQVQTLQQQTPLTEQIAQLTRERDEAAGQLAALRGDSESLSRATAELAKLRGDVTRLKTELQEMAQRSARSTNDQTLSEAVAWKNRINQLKQYLEQFPAAKIPELQFVTEEEWLLTVRDKLNTERDYRQAASSLRGFGEYRVVNMLQKALRGYMKANHEQFPTDLSQLQPYFDSPVDEAILQRWQIAPAALVQNYGLGGDMVITQKAAVDEVFDMRHAAGSSRTTSMAFLYLENGAVLNPVRQAFREAHNGRPADKDSQLFPYVSTPEQRAALQKTSCVIHRQSHDLRRVAVARQALCHQFGIAGISHLRWLRHGHLNMSVWINRMEVTKKRSEWPTGAFCQFVPPAGTRAGLSQRDNLRLWQRSRTPFYFIFIFFVRFSAPRDIRRRNA